VFVLIAFACGRAWAADASDGDLAEANFARAEPVPLVEIQPAGRTERSQESSVDWRSAVQQAGLALGFAALTRTPMAFMFPLFLFEAWRAAGGRDGAKQFLKTAALFSAPVIVMAALAMWHNAARFDQLTEFGHSYLAVRQQAQIETNGLFSHHYLSRNLTVLLTLLPDFGSSRAWVQISGHGLAIWVTTPIVLLLLWPTRRTPLARGIWVTVAAVAVPTLFYQNSGWVQFGYRFALDYMVLLFVLLAIGGRPLRWWVKGLIIVAIAINLFGAVTFGQSPEYYRTDGRTYSTVVAH